jgi:hypothetical protein
VRYLPAGIRTVLATAAATVVLAGAFAAPAAAEKATSFSADSGDACGVTQGILDWNYTPTVIPIPISVQVTGVVVDQPVGADAPAECVDDGRFTVVRFGIITAPPPGGPDQPEVLPTTQQVDNGKLKFSFLLGSGQRIEAVTVQVCRTTAGDVKRYCGLTLGFEPPA